MSRKSEKISYSSPSFFCAAALAFQFLDGRQQGSLESAINSQDWEAAFRAAHTLKGVAQNLGFQRLYLSSTALTEALRGPRPLTDPALREAVAMDQAALLTAIQELEDSHHSTEKT